ncbi:hypothetical protein [Nodosilinea nodulosa]|uniref:hypothetical protein n=1 Tax=Nodosilinea nodulosa TaxID=416001 RepID=UPI00030BD84E|nr:hypothetical protein [Nodosilinea nodulosa]
MKTNSLYAQLELIPESHPTQTDYSVGRAWAAAKAHLRPMASHLLAYLCGSTDVSVTVKRVGRRSAREGHRYGQTLFVAYDPASQRRYSFSSEQELRVWIDRRYYE